jgi:hypothetical protein
MKAYYIIKIFFFCAILFLYSCEDNSLKQTSLITVKGEATTRASSTDKGDIASDISPVVFTGNDISWFDLNTGEIKFNKSFEPDDLKVFQKVHFYLREKQLFTVSTYVRPFHSFASNDLVLYVETNGKCYLHDCYPLSIMETIPTVKENKEKRAVAWKQFIDQLEKERKIKK